MSKFYSAVCTLLCLLTGASTRGVDRSIHLVNQSPAKIEVYWVHPEDRSTVKMSDPVIVPGADFPLNSYVGHEFLIKEVAGKYGCRGLGRACRSTSFVVSENDDQVIRITEDIVADFVDNKVKARREAAELITECQTKAKERIASAGNDRKAAEKAMDDLVNCVHNGVALRLEQVNEEVAFQANVRRDIAMLLENYTCMDDTLNSTEDVRSEIWDDKGTKRNVHIKFDRPASKIHVIENFIDEDECQAMEEAAVRRLHRATVADGKGGSRLSENRKAMQAGVKVPWDQEEDGNPIARVSRRVYDYTNYVLGLGIEEPGQEDLMSIQYFGRGFNDTEPDRYTPHCDGDCTGLPHKLGTRMATMVLYCIVADRGGHTNFRNAGVHVKPEKGSGIFFSYIDPETKIMDTGFTEHSGCPVFEGEKKIVTQWIRLGVDEENPWDSFNTLGIKVSEMDDDDNEVMEGEYLHESNPPDFEPGDEL